MKTNEQLLNDLIVESNGLRGKMSRLEHRFNLEKDGGVADYDLINHALLEKQWGIMKEYHNVLCERVIHFANLIALEIDHELEEDKK